MFYAWRVVTPSMLDKNFKVLYMFSEAGLMAIPAYQFQGEQKPIAYTQTSF